MYKFYSKSKARVPMRVNLAMQQCLRSGVLLTLLLLSINVIARAQQITIKETRAPLKKVFQDLSKQTGFEFLASSAVLDVSQPVTFSVKDQPLGVVLETIFKTQPLKYEIRDKIIVVTKKK
ncbi:STN domain-containing protein [Mucilaginibacter sp. UC70_90]